MNKEVDSAGGLITFTLSNTASLQYIELALLLAVFNHLHRSLASFVRTNSFSTFHSHSRFWSLECGTTYIYHVVTTHCYALSIALDIEYL